MGRVKMREVVRKVGQQVKKMESMGKVGWGHAWLYRPSLPNQSLLSSCLHPWPSKVLKPLKPEWAAHSVTNLWVQLLMPSDWEHVSCNSLLPQVEVRRMTRTMDGVPRIRENSQNRAQRVKKKKGKSSKPCFILLSMSLDEGKWSQTNIKRGSKHDCRYLMRKLNRAKSK